MAKILVEIMERIFVKVMMFIGQGIAMIMDVKAESVLVILVKKKS